MSSEQIDIVFKRYLSGQASPNDLKQLAEYMQQGDAAGLKQQIRTELEKAIAWKDAAIDHQATERVKLHLLQHRTNELKRKWTDDGIHPEELDELHRHLRTLAVARSSGMWRPNGAAASEEKQAGPVQLKRYRIKRWSLPLGLVAACLCLAILMIDRAEIPEPVQTMAAEIPDDLTLADSTQTLIEFSDGTIRSALHTPLAELRERGIERIHLADRTVAFKLHPTDPSSAASRAFITPKGSVAHVIMSEGSDIWLNSNSTLQFTSFSDSTRQLTLQGEAYFEVSHRADHPFLVRAEGTDITVLGTAFNVATNQRADQVLTTLINGSVSVGTGQQEVIIRPNMQTASHKHNGTIDAYSVDSWSEIAWKNGFFSFNNDDIHTVLKKLSAWYPIEHVDLRKETNDRFSGKLRRTQELSTVLKSLAEISTYRFTINQGRITIM